jgi:hypothetical protein
VFECRVRFDGTRESGIAELAILLSRSGDAETAVRLLFSKLDQHRSDLGTAATVMAGELSRVDFDHAKTCLDIACGGDPFFALLAISNVLALDGSGLAELAEQLVARQSDPKRWLFRFLSANSARGGLDVLRRLDLDSIARHPTAQPVALTIHVFIVVGDTLHQAEARTPVALCHLQRKRDHRPTAVLGAFNRSLYELRLSCEYDTEGNLVLPPDADAARPGSREGGVRQGQGRCQTTSRMVV